MNTELIKQVQEGTHYILMPDNPTQADIDKACELVKVIWPDDTSDPAEYLTRQAKYICSYWRDNKIWAWSSILLDRYKRITALPLHRFFEGEGLQPLRNDGETDFYCFKYSHGSDACIPQCEKCVVEQKEDELETYISVNKEKIRLLMEIEQWAKENGENPYYVIHILNTYYDCWSDCPYPAKIALTAAYTKFADRLNILTK